MRRMKNRATISIQTYLHESIVGLKQLCFQKISDHQYLNDSKLKAMEVLIMANMQAAERAVIKAEEAQHEYNMRSNEFSNQLKDQASMFMSRIETIALFKSMDDKLEFLQQQLVQFRSFKDNQGGKQEGSAKMWILITGVFSFTLTLATLMTMLIHIAKGP